MKALKLACIILISTASNFIHAQNDFGLWTGVDLNIPLTKKIKFGIDVQTRFDRNVSRMKEAYMSPSVKWDVLKQFRVGFNYRLTRMPYSSDVLNRISTHRFTLDLELNDLIKFIKDKSRLEISLRVRGTNEHELSKLTENYLRYRIKGVYNLPKTKLEPSLSAELFYHFNDQIIYTFTEVKSINSFNKLRLQFGLKYPLGKSTVEIYSIYQRKFMNTESNFIIGLGYTYDLDRLIKKK